MFFTAVVAIYLMVAIIGQDSVPFTYLSICLFFRSITLVISYRWTSLFLSLSTATLLVDSACTIMAHPDMQNTIWLPIYGYIIPNSGLPPCPECFPDLETSWIFGISVSYMVMFVLPFRNVAFALPLCYGTYTGSLMYTRFNNYYRFDTEEYMMSRDVKHFTGEEIFLMSAQIAIALYGKVVMEMSERVLWQTMKDSQETALHEKILRCKAEHATENIKTAIAASAKKAEPPQASESTSYVESSVGAFSAPPILEKEFSERYKEAFLASRGECEDGIDCLQEADMVWTTETPHPIPIRDLSQGQRVLCYDHLGRGLKHVEVLSVVSKIGDAVQWATVNLKDGTSIKVTADHPILTESYGKWPCLLGVSQAPVRAGDLKPDSDKVLVMKLVPVAIQSVELDSAEELQEQTRVSINLQQPDRHSIFVSRADKVTPDSAIAVGASNVQSTSICPEYVLRAHNTFLNILED